MPACGFYRPRREARDTRSRSPRNKPKLQPASSTGVDSAATVPRLDAMRRRCFFLPVCLLASTLRLLPQQKRSDESQGQSSAPRVAHWRRYAAPLPRCRRTVPSDTHSLETSRSCKQAAAFHGAVKPRGACRSLTSRQSPVASPRCNEATMLFSTRLSTCVDVMPFSSEGTLR